ncbi:unnamed protein product [Calypogeia fissa]
MACLELDLPVLTVVLAMVAAVAIGASAANHACSELEGSSHSNGYYAFCDQSLDIESRVGNLVASLTLEEKLGLMVNTASGVARLGIPGYQWQNEGLHGVAHSPGVSFGGPIHSATSFPQPILTAASFNQTLFNEIGKAISTEARAFHNTGQGGLTYWTPNINIFRDPRWGRGQETPGEDPHLTSVYAEYFVRGLQEPSSYNGNTSSASPSQLKISACCKHFTAYDLEAWNGIERYGFNAVVAQQDLDDTFNPPFKSCIQKGRASGLMCSYNSVNGVPTCADRNLLTNIARDTWGFDGYVVSDCDAVQTIYANHKYTDPEHALAAVLKAGMDLNCGDTFSTFSSGASNNHLITEDELAVALTRSFTVQFRLGLFDNERFTEQNYDALGADNVCSEDHQRLALEAAVQGIVLLKNENNVLPLSREKIRNVAVIGPNADDRLNTMVGNYAGDPCEYVTPLQGLKDFLPGASIQYVSGCSETACESANFIADTVEARSAAATSDATIMVMGLGQIQETEAVDRTTLVLPGQQQELIMSVAANAKGPVVLIVMSGGPVDITFARDTETIGAIFWVGYPGQAGGQALAQIIFGDRNPGGKLPMTWYPETFTSWPMTRMDMRPDPASGYPGRTYRFYTGETVYQFGHGLSYSTFIHSFNTKSKHQLSSASLMAPTTAQLRCYEYSNNCADRNFHFCHSLEFQVEMTVSNTHWRSGSEVILLYASPPLAGQGGVALKQLVGFQRVHIEGNETTIVQFDLKPCSHFVTVGKDGTSEVLEGVHTVSSNSPDVELKFEFKRQI